MFRQLKGRNEVLFCAIYASGGLVSWIVLAWDVTCSDAEDAFSGFEESVDMFENSVDSSVAVSADVPSFDDASVVSIQYDVSGLGKVNVDSADKEFKANGFSPSDVLFSVQC